MLAAVFDVSLAVLDVVHVHLAHGWLAGSGCWLGCKGRAQGCSALCSGAGAHSEVADVVLAEVAVEPSAMLLAEVPWHGGPPPILHEQGKGE